MDYNEAIEFLEEQGAIITKDDFYYEVDIYDPSMGCRQDLSLTDDEVISLAESIQENL